MLKTITTDGLKALMDRKASFKLVNVLGRVAYSREHISDSINIPYEEIEALAPGLIRKDESVIVHCSGTACTASKTAGDKLEELGYTDVTRYEEGIEAWKEAGYRLEGEAIKAAV
jgi:rhodanese-related sulfurtransferase